MEQTPNLNKVALGIVFGEGENEGKVLMIDRQKHALGLTVAFPGGIIHPGESGEEAVVREFFEEVKLRVRVLSKLSERQHPNNKIRCVYYALELQFPNQTAEVGEKHEIKELMYVDPAEIKQVITSDLDPNVEKYLLEHTKSLTLRRRRKKDTHQTVVHAS